MTEEEKTEACFACVFCRQLHEQTAEKCPETGRELTKVHRLANTRLDDKYRVLDFIGQGGMGVVYEGENIELGKKCAVKFLNYDLRKSREMYERFKREAEAAGQIEHKCIVDVVDVGTTGDDLPYIVMELLTGESLRQRITRLGKIHVKESISILAQLLDALSAVHSHGIVHRDLKPENIFVASQSDGTEIVKILDFGLSRLSKKERFSPRMTQPGFVYGSPSYISPEQAEASLNIDHRSDLYSAGVIFYEMITGCLPFTGDNYARLIVEVLTKSPKDPRTYVFDPFNAVVNFINASLAKDRNDRFQSAREMLKELESLNPELIIQPSTPSARIRVAPTEELGAQLA
ncbi:MAG: serine/threonine-protein kinase, partial [Pseudomonadota bacterium]